MVAPVPLKGDKVFSRVDTFYSPLPKGEVLSFAISAFYSPFRGRIKQLSNFNRWGVGYSRRPAPGPAFIF